MRVIDVDAHLHEPLDWIEQTDPALAGKLGPPARFMDLANSVFGIANPALAELSDGQPPRAATKSYCRASRFTWR
jgi:hypothetical protein